MQEPGRFCMLSLNVISVFDIFFNILKVKEACNFVCCNDHTFVLNANEVGHDFQFDILKCSIDISDMRTRILKKCVSIIITYRNYDLFAKRPLGGHVYMWFGFTFITDDFLNYLDFFVLKIRECFLDLQCFSIYISTIR